MQYKTTLAEAFEALPEAVILTDAHGVIAGANAHASALFGYPPGTLSGCLMAKLVPEIREGRALTCRRRDGSEFPADISRSPIRPKKEALVVSVIRDATARVALEDAHRESEERYRALVDLSPEAIVVHAAGTIVYVNEATVNLLLASSREALIGRQFIEFVPPAYKEEVLRRMASPPDVVRKEGPLLVKATRGDGQEFFLEAIGSRIAYGGVPAAQVILRDISDRVRAYDELQASREELRRLSTHLQSARESERGAIAREIHDELGGALTALKFDLASLEELLPAAATGDARGALGEKLDSMAALIDGTVQTMRRIITQLRPVLLDSLGLDAALEWLAEDFQHRTGIPCSVEFRGGEIAPDHERATAVYRIVQETLTNVARHAGAAHVNITMELSGRTILLNVHDDGRGIERDRIQGSGSFGIIGMKERALIFGGELTIAAPADGGTTVSLRLPLEGTGAPVSAARPGKAP